MKSISRVILVACLILLWIVPLATAQTASPKETIIGTWQAIRKFPNETQIWTQTFNRDMTCPFTIENRKPGKPLVSTKVDTLHYRFVDNNHIQIAELNDIRTQVKSVGLPELYNKGTISKIIKLTPNELILRSIFKETVYKRITTGEVLSMEGNSKADRGNANIADLESNKIIDVVKKYMESIPPPPGIKQPRYNIDYTLKLIKVQGRWAKVHYIPIPFVGDPPGLLLEQVKGKWVVRVCGTDWSDWEDKLPPGF